MAGCLEENISYIIQQITKHQSYEFNETKLLDFVLVGSILRIKIL